MSGAVGSRPSRKITLSLDEGHSRGPLSYLEMGRHEGECVVFLHGFGADLLTWQLCLVPLAATCRVIAIDLPGHGRSTTDVGEGTLRAMTDWLDEAFDRLEVRDARLVGHSMGAKVALGYTLNHPDRVAGLGLISPAGIGADFDAARLDAFLEAQTPERAEALARQLVGTAAHGLVPALARSLYDAARDPLRAEAMRVMLGHAKQYGIALSPEGFDWARIRCPVTVVWGEQDRLIPMPDARRLPPGAPVTVLDGVGHLPHMEASGRVVEVLKGFLNECT